MKKFHKVGASISVLVLCVIVFHRLNIGEMSSHPARIPWVYEETVKKPIASPRTSIISTNREKMTGMVKTKQFKQIKNRQPAQEHRGETSVKVPIYSGNISSNSSSMHRKSRKKYLIYLCDKRRTCGGWGDRQRGMMAAYVFALVTGRTFGINMSYPCDLKLFYVPNEVNWYIKVSEISHLTWEVVDWMDNRNRSVDCESDFNARHPSDVVFLRTNQDVIYRMSLSPRYGKLVPKEFRKRQTAFGNAWRRLMKLSMHMEEHLDMFMSKIPKAGRLVCGHIRMRRSPTIPSDGKALTSMKNVDSMWRFLSRYEQNASRIFIASDSMEVRRSARTRFKNKELDTDGLVMHIDRQGKWNDACKGFEMALLEQAVLARCDLLVLSPSGFSVRAAMMSTIKQELFMYNNGTIKPHH